MKAVLLDGSSQDDMALARDAAARHLKASGYRVEVVRLREMDIGDCTGCFGCWIGEPGRCVVGDDATEVARLFTTSDVVAMLSPVTFGGYSYHLKKALDRCLCFAMPFMKGVRGETRHPRRYDLQQKLMVVGLLPRRDEEAQATFRSLAERNALNLQPAAWSCAFVYRDERPEMAAIAVKEALIGMGVRA